MSDVSPLSSSNSSRAVSGYNGPGREARSVIESSAVRRQVDQVEVSPMALYMHKLKSLPVRQDMVDKARAEIANGTYETPEKLDAAIDELLNELF